MNEVKDILKMLQTFKIGGTVYYVDKADILRPIKEKIVSEYCFNEKVSLIILRDLMTYHRTAYNLPCSCIFATYGEAVEYYNKLRGGN